MNKSSTIYFKTKNNNAYIYDFNKNVYHNAPTFFDNSQQIKYLCETKSKDVIKRHALEHNCTEKDLLSYLSKVKYLKRFGYFGSIIKEKRNETAISENVVRKNLSKIKHLLFEVTESCNLRCYYCGYGKLYNPVLGRHSTNLSFEKAKAIIDYLANFWRNDKCRNKTITVSFYGGEPLLNFGFIQNVVEYMNQLKLFDHVDYSITTNGLLLDKYIDFLFLHNFKVDVSLDGDYDGNKYRVDKNHKNQHNTVTNNIKGIIEKYPGFFKNKVNFQAVLSNANSVESITRFFRDNFDKKVIILELNTSNVYDKMAFTDIFKDYSVSLSEASPEIKKLYYQETPEITRFGNVVFNFLRNTLGNIYESPKQSLVGTQKTLITATCTPFWKKLFVTAKGNLMPCERINYNYMLGRIDDENKIEIKPDVIAGEYNKYYKSLASQCSNCYSSPFCVQCMFYVDDLGNKPVCQDFMDEKSVCEHMSNLFGFFEDNLNVIYSLINCSYYE